MRCAADAPRQADRVRTLIMIGHVTKEGALAGPRVLEHIVDTVLYFEGDTHSSFRLIRAFKNRFGAVNELGVFAMTDRGLKGGQQSVGAVPVTAGRRAWRRGAGLVRHGDAGRNAAVAGRDAGTGRHRARAESASASASASIRSVWQCCWRCCTGMPASPLTTRMFSSMRSAEFASPSRRRTWRCCWRSFRRCADRPLPRGLVAFGEVGLAGEIRPAPRGQERLREAAKLGFSQAIIPTRERTEAPDRGTRNRRRRASRTGARAPARVI